MKAAPKTPVADEPVDRLLGRVSTGDRCAFDRFYALYHGRVFRIVVNILQDFDLAEETTQEVFLQLWQQASRFDAHLGSTSAWIQRIAHARATDRLQATQATSARDTRYFVATHSVDYDTVIEHIENADEAKMLKRALQQLPQLQLQSIVLTYYAGLTANEISRQTDVNYSTVKTRIRDGLKNLSSEMHRTASMWIDSGIHI